MSQEERYDKLYSAAFIATSLVIAYIAAKYKKLILPEGLQLKIPQFRDPLKRLQIKEVLTQDESRELCKIFQEHGSEMSVFGFDCEWVTEDGKQKPVALLQLASHKGLCGLFRLCHLKQIPDELKEILEDRKIIKVGVSPVDDARFIQRDFGVQVNSCLDLRHLHPYGSGSLAALSERIIGIKINKHWKIRCSNWEAENLSEEQIQYAAKDAFVAIEIFKNLIHGNFLKKLFWKKEKTMTNIFSKVEPFLDIRFNSKSSRTEMSTSNIFKSRTTRDKPVSRGFSTRKSPLYHNCFMHAPDGELLCSCDQRKAEWYVERGLAEVIPGEPYSIKLLFEPAGRSSNTDEGRFYTQLKGNHCVVCGVEESYLRHSVIPKDYRKHFPNIMKDHQSHDVVLMCLTCHKISSEHDERLRRHLAEMCDAPLQNQKFLEIDELKKVQKAARALLLADDKLPHERKADLQSIVTSFYQVENLTKEILEKAVSMDVKAINENYQPHGVKVVEYFINTSGGLLELEKIWRENFLKCMKPRFLPYLWSVHHNHERLVARAAENRVNPEDLKIAGIFQNVDFSTKNQLMKECSRTNESANYYVS